MAHDDCFQSKIGLETKFYRLSNRGEAVILRDNQLVLLHPTDPSGFHCDEEPIGHVWDASSYNPDLCSICHFPKVSARRDDDAR